MKTVIPSSVQGALTAATVIAPFRIIDIPTGTMSKDPNEYHLLAFDPGGTTGWAHFCVDVHAFSRPEHKVLANLKWHKSGKFIGSEHEIESQIHGMLIAAHWGHMPFTPTVQVVSEDFELTQLYGGKELLSPVRINAVIAWLCATTGIPFELQARQLRTAHTKERMRLFGFAGRYQKDEFAALQHGVTYLRRLKAKSLGKPWKLGDSQSTNAFWDCACNNRGKRTRKRCDLDHPK